MLDLCNHYHNQDTETAQHSPRFPHAFYDEFLPPPTAPRNHWPFFSVSTAFFFFLLCPLYDVMLMELQSFEF